MAGPIIGLVVPALLLAGGKLFGLSSTFRDLCAATLPGRLDFFRYDWRREGAWRLAFVTGLAIGGFVAATLLAGPDPQVAISEATRTDLRALGLRDLDGLVPAEAIGWRGLLTLPGNDDTEGGDGDAPATDDG